MGNIDYEQIESSQRQHNEYMRHYNEMCSLGEKRILVFISELKTKFSKDGNAYCFLFGDDLQEGIGGFGDTPYGAALDLYNQFMGIKTEGAK
jgi:hypothetical protein